MANLTLLVFSVIAAVLAASPGAAMPLCGDGPRVTCVVDGDTFWFRGEKIRLAGIDAPELLSPACPQERELAIAATMRLADLLDLAFTIERTGTDRFGRTLAAIRIGDTTAGEILVEEGLAQVWHGRKAEWCAR